MCGRFTLTKPQDLAERFGVAIEDLALTPRYNIAPTQEILAIVEDAEETRALVPLRWGFTVGPPSSGRPAPINARAETLVDKPLFRSALRSHRCLIAADGFYEWAASASGRGKQPHYFRLRDGRLFGFAGLYTPPQQGSVGSCALITTAPNALVAPIHNRMPVILRRHAESLWLDSEITDPAILVPHLTAYPAAEMEERSVSMRVSHARVDDASLLDR